MIIWHSQKYKVNVYTKDQLINHSPKIEANKGQLQLINPKCVSHYPKRCFVSQGLTKCLGDIISLPFSYSMWLSGLLFRLLLKDNGVWAWVPKEWVRHDGLAGGWKDMNNIVNLKVTLENIKTCLNNNFWEIRCIVYSNTYVQCKTRKCTNEHETGKMVTTQKLDPPSLMW